MPASEGRFIRRAALVASDASALSLLVLLAACGGGQETAGAGPAAAPAVSERVAFGRQLPRAPVEPLGAVGVPDVNAIGLLEGEGGWTTITNRGQKTKLRALGKALFWDMQVGGDGIQACASCHFHAGADHRITNQINPGRGDLRTELVAINGRLQPGHYMGFANGRANGGFGVDEAALIASGATPDAVDGTPGSPAASRPPGDVNDVASSQGVRVGSFVGVTPATDTNSRVDTAVLASQDTALGFDAVFSSRTPQLPATARRVPGRNSPSVLNAVFNLRNFWDGRANMFFNGVNPFGANDPAARVKVFSAGGLGEERLDIPLSSLASQAVGPIGSSVEMTFEGRPLVALGKKLTQPGAVPLKGQFVDPGDSLLGTLRNGSGRGLNRSYGQMIRDGFHQRFWGNGSGADVCLTESGALDTPPTAPAGECPRLSLLQWNFPLFFGLAIQAYEASLVTGRTMVDLIAGGVATGNVINGALTVPVEGLALEGCIAAASVNQSPAEVELATNLCTTHYAKFIDAGARTGSESATAPFPVPAGTDVGDKCGGRSSTRAAGVALDCRRARDTLLNVNEGLNRFFSGNTACAVCHFNPEFTGATVSAQTRFGARLPDLPNGQLRKELEARAIMERMLLGNGAAAVYDVGFYNIGVRPTVEDIAIGDKLNSVPLSFSRMASIAAGGPTAGADAAATRAVFDKLGTLRLPSQPDDLTPLAFPLFLGCGPGLVGQGGAGDANNNPAARCANGLNAAERLQVNGSFKTPGLRNVRFTGPYMHNGSKMTIRQVLEFYKTSGHFTQINRNNLDAGMRTISLAPAEESALVELMETGLTDWRVAYKRAPFDHPELCLPHGHDNTGATAIVAIPAVGSAGATHPIATFAELLSGATEQRSHSLNDKCSVPGIVGAPPNDGRSQIDWIDGLLGIAP